VSSVEVCLDGETCDRCGTADQGPVYFCTHGRDFGEGLAVRGGEGVEGGGGDFCTTVAAVEVMVEKEADFGDHEGACYDEGAEEVVDGVGLQGED